MTEIEALVLRNILNGIEPAAAALAAGLEESRGLEIFTEAMRRVAEYQLVMCVPHFPVSALAEARMARRRVLEILGAIERWDDHEREIASHIFKGKNVVKEGVPREDAERVLGAVLDALPNYLEAADLRAYTADRGRFVRENRSRVLGALERFPSLREPLQFKKIEHQYIALR